MPKILNFVKKFTIIQNYSLHSALDGALGAVGAVVTRCPHIPLRVPEPGWLLCYMYDCTNSSDVLSKMIKMKFGKCFSDVFGKIQNASVEFVRMPAECLLDFC